MMNDDDQFSPSINDDDDDDQFKPDLSLPVAETLVFPLPLQSHLM